MSDAAPNETKSRMIRALLIVIAGIVVPGLVSRAFHQAGLSTLGAFSFAVGFFGMLVVVWYLWLRPLDITGPIE